MKNLAYFFIIATGCILLLIYGKGLLIPIVFAGLLWFMTREIRQVLDKVSFIEKSFPSWLKNLIVFILMVFALSITSNILTSSIGKLSDSYSSYEPNVQKILDQIEATFNIDLSDTLKRHLGDFNFSNILSNILGAFSGLISNAFMIVIYAVFIILEEGSFAKKLKKVFTKENQHEKVIETLVKIETSIASYLGLKSLVSFITAFASFIVLSIVGVDAPVFWALLIFIFNFIPNIGSLIATLFPTIFCLVQFGEFTPALIVLFFVGSIQLVVGNLIEPRVMGKSLNLSPFVTLLALSLWGVLWGITGMFLSVPITVIMVIILSQFPKTKNVAIMLSENGELD